VALSIININVNVSGTSTRFFNILATPVTNAYYNLFINGVLQEGDSYTVSVTELTFNTVTGAISAGTPIIIEAVELVTVI